MKQMTQDTIEFTPEDLIGQTKMKEIAKQFSLSQDKNDDETKGTVGTHGSLCTYIMYCTRTFNPTNVQLQIFNNIKICHLPLL